MNDLATLRFDSTILRDVAIAIERRGKAIRYHGKLECGRLVEDAVERFIAEFTAILGFRIRLSIWPDGAVSLVVNKPGPRRTGGWEYCEQLHTHLDGLDAPDVVDRFEQTIHSPTEVRGIWPVVE